MLENFNPIEEISGDLSKGLLLLCDHARNTLPAGYGTLGLPQSELQRHIGYDIGAEALTRGLAERLGVPAILTTYSRLLIDPNRGEDDPTLIRQLYDGTIIPGNYPLSAAERTSRRDRFYRPYHDRIAECLGEFAGIGVVPAVLAIHSMTDRWNGQQRPWHFSVLWDSDRRFAGPLMEGLRAIGDLTIGENEPYDGALEGDTLYRHCTLAGLSHALLEVRQDLVREDDQIGEWVTRLAPVIVKVNALPHNHVIQKHDSRTARMARPAVKRN
ncbi:MAG: N-formylglutamate amidohydrolase [Nitratireductor sp.]|nr:N-formylglutamate amidohydrolase [Nitratireductor sp.]